MNKKILTFLIIFIAAISMASVYAVETTNQDFDGLFKMDVPLNESFPNSSELNLYSPGLCSSEQYGDDSVLLGENSGVNDNITIYYYDESAITNDFEPGNTTNFVVTMLKSNSIYMDQPTVDEGLYIWNSDGKYLVGIPSDDDTQFVCIEGLNLDDLKTYAASLEFEK